MYLSLHNEEVFASSMLIYPDQFNSTINYHSIYVLGRECTRIVITVMDSDLPSNFLSSGIYIVHKELPCIYH